MEMIKTCCLLMVLSVAWAAPEFITYPPEVDKMDVDAFINDKARIDKFVTCLLEDTCDQRGQVVKDVLLDAFETHCSKCSASERIKMRKVIKHIIENEHDAWTKIIQRYDPQLTHAVPFRQFLEDES